MILYNGLLDTENLKPGHVYQDRYPSSERRYQGIPPACSWTCTGTEEKGQNTSSVACGRFQIWKRKKSELKKIYIMCQY